MPDVWILLKAKDEASKALKGVNKSVGGLKEGIAKLGIAGPLAIGAVAAGVGKLAWDAMKLEPTRITFENLSDSIGSTADAMLYELRPATMGMVSDADLMASANKLISMGLAKSEKEAAKLAKMATTLGMAMGKGPTQAMEEFALMMANQSIPRLDTFGISAGTVRTRITELMEATEGLTREQAFMQAVMEQGEISMERVGDISDTTAVKMARVQTAVSNLKAGIGNLLIPILDAGATAFLNLQEVMSQEIGIMSEASEATKAMTLSGEGAILTQEKFIATMYKSLPPLTQHEILTSKSKKAVFDAAYAQEFQNYMIDQFLGMQDPWQEDMENIVAVTDDATVSTEAWAGALSDVQSLIKEQEQYLSAIEEAIGYAEELGLAEEARTLKLWLAIEATKEVGPAAKTAFIDEMLAYIKETNEPTDVLIEKMGHARDAIFEIGPAFDIPIQKIERFSGYYKDLRDKTIWIDVKYRFTYTGYMGGPGFEGPPGAEPPPGFEAAMEEAFRDAGRYAP